MCVFSTYGYTILAWESCIERNNRNDGPSFTHILSYICAWKRQKWLLKLKVRTHKKQIYIYIYISRYRCTLDCPANLPSKFHQPSRESEMGCYIIFWIFQQLFLREIEFTVWAQMWHIDPLHQLSPNQIWVTLMALIKGFKITQMDSNGTQYSICLIPVTDFIASWTVTCIFIFIYLHCFFIYVRSICFDVQNQLYIYICWV